MNILIVLMVLSGCLSLGNFAVGQNKLSPLDEYLASGKTIVIAKCVAVGPIKITPGSDVAVEVLLAVKGTEKNGVIGVFSDFPLEVGRTYLLRTTNEAVSDRRYFRIDGQDSAIPLLSTEQVDFLKTLPPRTIILRALNQRIDTLRYEIESRQFELDKLSAIKKGN
jgi:hypothetical protein